MLSELYWIGIYNFTILEGFLQPLKSHNFNLPDSWAWHKKITFLWPLSKSWPNGYSQTHNRKIVGSSLRTGRNCRWGEWMYSTLSPPSIPRRGALEQDTEPPTAPRAPQHKWLPTATGVCSRCVCSLLYVCINSEYGSPYLAVCHITFTYMRNCTKYRF